MIRIPIRIRSDRVTQIQIRILKTGSVDLDPKKKEPDPQHWLEKIIV